MVSPMHARFDTPGLAGTNVGVADEPQVSAVTDEEAYNSTKSLKLQWAFVSASNNNNHLRATTNEYLYNEPTSHETFLNPDPVVPFSSDGTWCDGDGDIAYSFMFKMEPTPLMGDCDFDGDVDLVDFGCFQDCYATTPLSSECDTWFDYFRDNDLNADDFQMFNFSVSGPQ